MTNLYKSAAASQEKARTTGYQDALDDLLAFLDKENLGLMDGEGWRVRQWATERLVDDGSTELQRQSAGDDGEAEARRELSPEAERKPQPHAIPTSPSELAEDTSPQRRTAISEPPVEIRAPVQVPSLEDFTFRSSTHAYPTNHEREAAGMDLDNTPNTTASTPSSTESVRFITRPTRGRHTNHLRPRGTGTSTINLNLGAGAGSKRKMPYPDFFDISGFEGQERKDGSGSGGGGGGGGRGGVGGKRGRHA